MKISNFPNKTISFFKEVMVEIKKVNWPTRQETIRYTLVVIGVSLAVALFLGLLDFFFTTLMNKFVI